VAHVRCGRFSWCLLDNGLRGSGISGTQGHHSEPPDVWLPLDEVAHAPTGSGRQAWDFTSGVCLVLSGPGDASVLRGVGCGKRPNPCESGLKHACQTTVNNAVVRVRTSSFPTLTHDRSSELSCRERVSVDGFNDCSLLYISENKSGRTLPLIRRRLSTSRSQWKPIEVSPKLSGSRPETRGVFPMKIVSHCCEG
jgi:hypothetical protein